MTLTTIINVLLFIAICVFLIHIFRGGSENTQEVKPSPKNPYHDPRLTVRRQAIVEHLPKKPLQQQPNLRLISYNKSVTPPPVFAAEKTVVEHLDEFSHHKCEDCA